MPWISFRSIWKSLQAWYWRRTRAETDLVVIALLSLPVFAFVVSVDAFDRFFEFSRAQEQYELDEVVSFAFVLGLSAIIFSFRRIFDLRREMASRRADQHEAHRLARHDVLTGLPNRRSFLEEFQNCADRLAKDHVCALFIVDLDHFKPINDLYGHRLGDEVLRVVASRLLEIVDGGGLVARLGGDEFGILMRFIRDDDASIRVARRIVYDIPKPISLAALSLEVGVSVGIAVYDPASSESGELTLSDGSQVETTMRQADMAMYRAKIDGRGLYHFFDRDMDKKFALRVQLEREIKGAIAKGEIVPYYHPLVDLKTLATLGYEILARWVHPINGVLLPDVFIPIAEDTGSIGGLTYSLLTRAVQDAQDWPEDTFLSLNLSPRLFADPHLSQRILGILTEAGFPPQRLEIEITETAVVQRLEEAKATLQSLRNLGVRIALDDFGTGYAGLHHLQELPLDTLKIDRSFITHMLDKPEEAKVVGAIVGLGHSLGLQTTAEGIETQEVLDQLTKLGCETGQGFLFGKPGPVAVPGDAIGRSENVRRIAYRGTATRRVFSVPKYSSTPWRAQPSKQH